MIFQADSRKSVSGARNVFGLLLALWVSLAIQPCAVAAVSKHDCPHCPTEIEAAAGSQHHHGAPAAEEHAASVALCDEMQGDCCDIDESIVNVRADSTDSDHETPAFVAIAPPPGQLDIPRVRTELTALAPEPGSASVPLHILKCVYLI